MKYFFIAGEASGDLHGADVVSALMKRSPDSSISGMGGDKMQQAGMELIAHYKAYSFMGFVEVVLNLRAISKLFKIIKQAILDTKPDKVVLIDYGGFNLKIAKFCKEHKIETHFYILPKVWAWNEKRIVKIRNYVDYAYCIFPFEEEYFTQRGVDAKYVGNPVVAQINRFRDQLDTSIGTKQQIALLPGSRKQEIAKMVPPMLALASKRSDLQFVLSAHDPPLFKNYKLPNNVSYNTKSTYELLAESQAAIVTSGTANLETALIGTPQIVGYIANPISFFIGKRLVKLKYISPVNLIMDKLVIKELIQDEFNVVNLDTQLAELLDSEKVKAVLSGYKELAEKLGYQSAAESVTDYLLK